MNQVDAYERILLESNRHLLTVVLSSSLDTVGKIDLIYPRNIQESHLDEVVQPSQ